MKIGIITDSVREQSTGIGFYTKDVVTKMLKMDKKNDYTYIDYLETDFNKGNLLYYSYPFRYYKTILWHALLPKRIRDVKLDYILNFSANPHYLTYKQKEIFFVYDVSWYLFPHFHPTSRSMMYKIFFERCLRNCYKIVVDSVSTKNDLVTYFSIDPSKILVIYPTVPEIKSRVNLKKREKAYPYFLFIGTLEPRKNIESIIKAYLKLKKEKKIKHKLIICGKKGWLFENIFKLIDSSGLKKEIVYKGYISNEEKEDLMRNAECFIYPSFYEGFGIPVLEAMSYGCPVITSNISSLPEVTGKAGIQVNPKDIIALSNAMLKIVTDKKMRAANIQNGFKQLEKLNNTGQIKELLRIISK